MFFIKVTDATTNKDMVIRGDLIFKIEEWEKYDYSNNMRRITFVDGEVEFVTDTLDDLIHCVVRGIEGKNDQ